MFSELKLRNDWFLFKAICYTYLISPFIGSKILQNPFS